MRKKLLEQVEAYTVKKAELDKDMPENVEIYINGFDHSSGIIVYVPFADELFIQRNNRNCEVQFKGEQIDQLLSALKKLEANND